MESLAFESQIVEIGNCLDVDDEIRRDDIVSKPGDQIGAPGEDPRRAGMAGKEPCRLLQR